MTRSRRLPGMSAPDLQVPQGEVLVDHGMGHALKSGGGQNPGGAGIEPITGGEVADLACVCPEPSRILLLIGRAEYMITGVLY